MRKSTLLKLLTFGLLLSLMLVACGNGDETEAAATTAPDEGDGEEFVGTSVSAESCDYGGKILSIEAVDELTVVFTLCSPDPAFPGKAAFTPFGILPAEFIAATGGTGDILEQPVGTGPYMVSDWVRGESVTYTRFDDYWGDAPAAETVVLRWNAESAARLLELQAGTADMVTLVSKDDFQAIEDDPNLQLIPVPNPNIFYIGFTNTFAPWDNVDVRRAVGMGIDRQRIVDNFYPPGSEVASHFTPCSIPNGCAGDEWYEFDLEAANALLDDAGFPRDENGVRFTTSIYFRDVVRVYLPQAPIVAVEIQTQLLENLGIDAEVVEMESGEFITESGNGRLDGLHLLGWGADYPHVTNFLDFHFGRIGTQFGDSYPDVYEQLEAGAQIGDEAAAQSIYEAANNAIRELLPMVPIAHGTAADAALASLGGAYTPPFGATQFMYLDPGDDTLVYVQNAEPIGLWCADMTDGESLRPCQQVVETLLEYGQDSGEVHGELATSCTSNDDGSVWTCALRSGVLFHDGSSFDANDVVASWAVGLDMANPSHVGSTGDFFYFGYLWDSFINAED
ncbi:MAG: peptide ABC transporter substrate-binding protein [Chloroflexi bacterium]|nr:peptide ABC transporter substrate-binding protein [Chloroflexota bacterium]